MRAVRADNSLKSIRPVRMTILAPGVIAMTSRERAPRVLVVDEQQPIREFIDQLLTAEGYEVELAPSLEGARERLAGGRPDLVICDARPRRARVPHPGRARRRRADAP